jgi:hypothetical protein
MEVTMSKQTAVKWLWLNLTDDMIGELSPEQIKSIYDVVQQAKAMEKEQIVDAHFEGQCDNTEGYPLQIAKQYYNETYKGDTNE